MKPKGFTIPDGYIGLMPNGRYQRFETEQAYIDYIKEVDNDDDGRADREKSEDSGE